jgi:TonB family protein
MKKIICVFCALLLVGCAGNVVQNSLTQPQLLQTSKLPPITPDIYSPNFSLEAEMLVDENGNVSFARLIDSTGNRSWDSQAVASLKEWKFTPARLNDRPVKTLIRRKIKVNFGNPVYMNLAQIICSTSIKADSAYRALRSGEDFHTVSKKYAINSSEQHPSLLENVDVNCYPEDVQEALINIDVDEFTKPVHYGENYVIFKRLQMIE